MKVYCGKNLKGKWKASLDIEKIKKFKDIFESEVPQINGNRVWMIKVYRGYDNDYINNRIVPVESYHQQLFHSVASAKKSDIWQKYLLIAKNDAKHHHISDFCIASDDNMGQPFEYGDIMDGKFNIKIIPVMVISDKVKKDF